MSLFLANFFVDVYNDPLNFITINGDIMSSAE